MKRARTGISFEWLAECLHLPKGTEVVDVRVDHFGGQIEFVFSHPSLRELVEAEAPSKATAVLGDVGSGDTRWVQP